MNAKLDTTTQGVMEENKQKSAEEQKGERKQLSARLAGDRQGYGASLYRCTVPLEVNRGMTTIEQVGEHESSWGCPFSWSNLFFFFFLF